MQLLQVESIWVDGSGRPVPAHLAGGLDSDADRIHAVDRLGWVNLRPAPDRIEFWVNPISVQQPTLCTAFEVTAKLQRQSLGRPVVVTVHDRESRGELVAESVEDLSSLIQDSVELTTRPGFPLMHDRLTGCLPTEIDNAHVHEMWRYLVATQFRPSPALMQRVTTTDGRAKVVMVNGHAGTVQFLAHDPRTRVLWNQQDGFVGRFLHDLPVPKPVRRSLKCDLMNMAAERQIVVSFVRGMRRVMPGRQTSVDSFFRITIPLRWQGDAPERPALVLIAPYA